MPKAFFSNFPKTDYDLGCVCGDTEYKASFIRVTDITRRFRIRELVKSKASLFYTYNVKDSERPDTVAYKFYDDPKLDWVVLMTNTVFDPFWDWPMGYYSFKEFIKGKYGSLPEAHQTVHHYEKIVQNDEVLFDGTHIPERTIIIDETEYHKTVDTDRKIISMYDYEKILNQEKATIKILDKSYIPKVVNEAERIFNRVEV